MGLRPQKRSGRRGLIGRAWCALASAVLAGPLAAGPRPAAAQALGTPIDLARYEQTFVEEFDKLDVSSRGPGTRWIAHTPWNGDFGDALFTDPGPLSPFRTANGKLSITMARTGPDRRLRSGLLASVDPKMQGFSQKYGYFEMSAKFPPGEGVWPAFWLIGVNRTPTASEVDIVEYYGKMTDRYYATLHVWDKVNKPPKNLEEKYRVFVPSGSLTREFHTYGVEIDEKKTTFYFDRKVVRVTDTRPEHRQPMFILVNLAAGGGWPITNLPAVSVLEVDYVKVWRKRS